VVEGLAGCEALQKVDLTVNFVCDLTSVESLAVNGSLRELYLTGNPCAQFDGYREFVIAVLPQVYMPPHPGCLCLSY
jgi:protein TilB